MEAHCETLGVYAPARQHGLKFELATKHRCRKLDEAKTVLLAHDRYPKDLAATELPVTSRHAIVVGQLEWGNLDPFDRILAAQSVLEDVSLDTRNAARRAVGGVRVERT